MIRALLASVPAAALLLSATSAMASGVYVNGVHTPSGSTVTMPAEGSMTISTAPMLGHGAAAGQYQVIQSAPMTTHGATTTYHTAQPAPMAHGAATYHTAQPAPMTTHATTTYESVQPATYSTATYEAVQPVSTVEYHTIDTRPAQVQYQTIAPATAHPVAHKRRHGWSAARVYVAPRAGISLADSTRLALAAADPIVIDNEYDDPGFTGSIAVGVGVPTGWHKVRIRTELEGGYAAHSVESHTIRGIGKFEGDDVDGDTDVLYGFLNGYVDVPVSHRVALTAGGGVGVGRVSFDGHGVRGAGTAADDDATTFGYHLDAGVSVNIAPNVDLEALYRYQSFVDADIRTENGNDTKVDVDSHNFLAGVRFGL